MVVWSVRTAINVYCLKYIASHKEAATPICYVQEAWDAVPVKHYRYTCIYKLDIVHEIKSILCSRGFGLREKISVEIILVSRRSQRLLFGDTIGHAIHSMWNINDIYKLDIVNQKKIKWTMCWKCHHHIISG